MGEDEFQFMCSKLININRSIGTLFKLQYYEDWVTAVVYGDIPREKRDKEQQ